MPINTWLDPQRTSYGFSYCSLWSLAGFVHVPGGGHLPLPRLRQLICRSWHGTSHHSLLHQTVHYILFSKPPCCPWRWWAQVAATQRYCCPAYWRDASPVFWQATTAMAADSRDRMTAALLLWLWGLLGAVRADWWQSLYSAGF